MELKNYQKQVIDDLHQYFEYLQLHKKADTAFNSYWQDKVGSYNPLTGEGMRPYQNTVPEAVHLSIKVPTAGGKTFLACNALKTIFDAMANDKPRAVVWLVPWSNLLDQTVKNLSNPDHPYCQKLNSLFNNRVQVFEKKDLLQGAGFNASSVREQLSVMVVNFSSIRAKNKEDRKFNEQNSNLSSFSNNIDDTLVLEGTEKEALINVIRSLNPILVVDESHNAESDLSVEMLNNLNPSFILDLTATPKQNANIVSLVSAFELKKEHMVKLPVIVYGYGCAFISPWNEANDSKIPIMLAEQGYIVVCPEYRLGPCLFDNSGQDLVERILVMGVQDVRRTNKLVRNWVQTEFATDSNKPLTYVGYSSLYF